MDSLRNENADLKKQIALLEEKLKKYTNPQRNKKYYENHKEELIEQAKQYKANSKEKIQEYNRRYYEKKKQQKSAAINPTSN